MKTRDLTLMALMLALLIICSQIQVQLGIVPLTFQTLAVLLIGYLLPPRHALITTLSYLLIGLIGLPVFAGYSGGPGSIVSPAFGFIIGFVLAATTMSWYLSRTKRTFVHYMIAAVIATSLIYFVGLCYMTYILNVVLGKGLGLMAILQIGMLPFLIGDVLKAIAAILIAKRLLPLLR